MRSNQLFTRFIIVVLLLTGIMAVTSKNFASKIRVGLEFRGGYEIYYVATPKTGKTNITPDDMLLTAKMLRSRVDKTGLSEPEIKIEGKNHIRLKLPGLMSLNDVRTLIGDSSTLPVTITEKYTQTVGSVLGATALKETLIAGFIAIVCMFSVLIFLYRGIGLIACFSTLVYLWILVVLFSLSQATLSLSAFVAFVLGIGMAADASIICFEHVKENLKLGLALPEATRHGFRSSFSTICDANFVTALAMGALFIAGIGPIEGFSITMVVSIIVSVITNFFLVRYLCVLLADSNAIPQNILVSGHAIKLKNKFFEFTKIGRIGIFVSVMVICSGILYYRAHGLNLDIDFTSGTALDIDVDRTIDQDTATKIMTDSGIIPATVSIGGKDNKHIAARFDQTLAQNDLQKVLAGFKSKYSTVDYEENTADPAMAHDFTVRAIYAVSAALLSIGLFIGWRFSWAVSIATIIAIVHDLLMVFALFSLFKLEIDVTFIAALLTVMGYSLNDKIVIFGRIRENTEALKNNHDVQEFKHLTNLSIQQTLGRSLYTVLTVVLASTCIYLFACEPLQMFSLALIIGLLSGAYSSIFISSLIWLYTQTFRAASPKEFSHRAFIWGTVLLIILTIPAWFAIPARTANAVVATAPSTSGDDLQEFRKIAEDTFQFVDAHNIAQARTRIKDLETAWDYAAQRMKSSNPSMWISIDKSIDRALVQIRSGAPDEAQCKEALTGLIIKLQSSGPTPAAVTADSVSLAEFDKITSDTLQLIQAHNLSQAKKRITDLETAWDKAEEKMKPMNSAMWTSIDKSIDRALVQVRSGSPDEKLCIEALMTLNGKLKVQYK